ncbi:hypothetical protein BPOR_0880g00050 [Botrytis porri]|uniref:Uncharacterized protein n=1 Tax=Botrytis porri TaxID=87229 RepID=A0A4Z1KLB8_9HELO|nr:hypothetical protein BPOR_0880g00050 [Botrytis porri]
MERNSPLPWGWKCKRMVEIWSDPEIPPSTLSLRSCGTLNEGEDVCTACNTYIEIATFEVVHQTAPPPPPPPTRKRTSRRGPTPR